VAARLSELGPVDRKISRCLFRRPSPFLTAGPPYEHLFYYKRAKASEIMFGDANHHREEIARKVVDGDED